MIRIIFTAAIFCALFVRFTHGALTQTKDETIHTNLQILPTDPDDIVLFSQPGQDLFHTSTDQEVFFKLASQFVTQENQGFCGPASSVMVLNALQANMSVSPEYRPYAYWTQHAWVETPCLQRILKHTFIGMTLSQIQRGLACSGVRSEVHLASNSTVHEFRKLARDTLSNGLPLIVNFNRKQLHEKGYGHFSPIAAYNSKHDRFLLMDVARYKYPPVWVRAETMFKAMNTRDIVSRTSRGFLVVTGVDN